MRAAFIPSPDQPRKLWRRDILGNSRAATRSHKPKVLAPALDQLTELYPARPDRFEGVRPVLHLVSGGGPW